MSPLMGLVTFIFDRETGVRGASKVENPYLNLSMLGLRVLPLFAMYAMDGRMDKSKPYCGWGYSN